jgi:hypothetical protein
MTIALWLGVSIYPYPHSPKGRFSWRFPDFKGYFSLFPLLVGFLGEMGSKFIW